MWYVGLGIAATLFGVQMIPFLSNATAVAWPTATPLGVPNSFVLALAVALARLFVERYTRLGRTAYAIGNDEGVARLMGLPVGRTVLAVFAIAGACSGLAGVMGSLAFGVESATIGVGTLFLRFVAIVIGGTPLSDGRCGVMRAVLSVLILSTLTNGLILAGVNPSIQSGVSGAVLIAAGWARRDRLRIVK